jgi:hypothetical protein
MKRNSMKRNSKYTGNRLPGVLFTLVCFAGAALGLWLFWMDINQVLLKGTENPAGILSYKRHVVQRRFEDRLMWNQIPRESPVYNGDLVRTSDISDAVITFGSDDRVSLSENSLIHIRYDAESNSFIELMSGSVSLVSASGRMGVLSGNQTLLPGQGGILEVSRGPGGTEAKALRGRTEISGPGGVSNLEEGHLAKTSPDETVDIAEIMVVSGPLPNQELQAEGDFTPVTFSWNSLSPSEYIRLEIARDRDFTDFAHSSDEYDTLETVALLPPGAWWWRIFQAGRGSPLPSTPAGDGRLTILEAPPSAPPEDIAAFLSGPDGEEYIRGLPALYSAPPAGTPVSPPPAEAEALAASVTEAVAAALAAAPVAAAPAAPSVETSRPPALLSAPQNLFPPQGTVIDGAYLKSNTRIIFSWDTVAGANAYVFTIRRGLTVNLHLIREPRFVFTGLPSLDDGEWVWQVEAVSLNSNGSTRLHGETSDSGFLLEVPRPNVPEVTSPGIMYER